MANVRVKETNGKISSYNLSIEENTKDNHVCNANTLEAMYKKGKEVISDNKDGRHSTTTIVGMKDLNKNMNFERNKGRWSEDGKTIDTVVFIRGVYVDKDLVSNNQYKILESVNIRIIISSDAGAQITHITSDPYNGRTESMEKPAVGGTVKLGKGASLQQSTPAQTSTQNWAQKLGGKASQ